MSAGADDIATEVHDRQRSERVRALSNPAVGRLGSRRLRLDGGPPIHGADAAAGFNTASLRVNQVDAGAGPASVPPVTPNLDPVVRPASHSRSIPNVGSGTNVDVEVNVRRRSVRELSSNRLLRAKVDIAAVSVDYNLFESAFLISSVGPASRLFFASIVPCTCS